MPTTVLIVDDHAGFRRAARRLLEAEGYDVTGESATGGEALEAAARLEPEVVLLDIGLPDLDGVEVSARLTRADPTRAVVLTSTRDATECDPLVKTCGARGFIPKSELTGEALASVAGRGDGGADAAARA
jgi:DNA-binding NarL/FixJ family response regulator